MRAHTCTECGSRAVVVDLVAKTGKCQNDECKQYQKARPLACFPRRVPPPRQSDPYATASVKVYRPKPAAA